MTNQHWTRFLPEVGVPFLCHADTIEATQTEIDATRAKLRLLRIQLNRQEQAMFADAKSIWSTAERLNARKLCDGARAKERIVT